MSPNLESFCPKLRPGRVIPQGSRIIFETDNPYNQIILPMALADMILLCSGQFSVREIIDKVYKKQGAVPFKSMLTAIHVLHQGGFFENGNQLVLSSHLQSWIKPRESGWHLSWRFGQRIAAASRAPLIFYWLTLVVLIAAILGLEHAPSHPVALAKSWSADLKSWSAALMLLVCSSALQTIRYLFCGIQLLLLTSKAYNVSLRLDLWGLHLHVGDEANDLFENRLYTSMYHVSQILVPWAIVVVAAPNLSALWFNAFVIISTLLTYWELNPFKNSEARKLIRALLLPSDREVASWHFEGNQLLNSINPDARKREQDFAHICAIWGVFWLGGAFILLHWTAEAFGPGVLAKVMHLRWESLSSLFGLGAWLATLYYAVQAFVETMVASVARTWWQRVVSRVNQMRAKPSREWPLAEVLKHIESLPLFSHFHEQYLERIVTQAQVQQFSDGTTIIREGEGSRELYVLLEGDVDILRRQPDGMEVWLTRLGAISVFGEAALVDESPRAAQVSAKGTATVLRVPVSIIRKAAEEAQSVRQLEVFRNAILVNQFFASSPVFRSLSSSSIEFLCSRGTLEYFDLDQFVFRQGETGDSLYLILRGSVEVSVHETPIKRLRQGSFFGEIALIANIPRTAGIRTCEPCAFFKISSDAFWEVLVQHVDLGVFIETVSEVRLKEDLALTPTLPLTGSDS